jgi:hypothetical protein
VNFIKVRALNSRLFKVLCDEMGAEHSILIWYTEKSGGGELKNWYFSLRN